MYLTLRYGLERVVAALLLLALSPLFLVIALLIVLDDGRPVFFRQPRIGRHGRPFSIWKFRSMVKNADDLLVDGRPMEGVRRITRVGWLLRKTSLDELPQLLNILAGEMAIIGPRPLVPERYEQLTPEQMPRMEVLPGVTGLAQVAGRNTVLWSERLRLDVQYIEEVGFRLDLRILLSTLFVVFKGQGVILDRNPDEVDDL